MILLCWVHFFVLGTFSGLTVFLKLSKENPMAKGQVRGNKEAKKPKKPKQAVVPVGSFITPPKADKPIKGR